MANQKVVYLIAAIGLIASASIGIAACSSTTNDVTPVVPGPDGAKADTSSPGVDSGPLPEASDQDTSVAPCANPPKLYAPSDAGVYCPYSKSDASATQYCAPGSQVCCLAPIDDAGGSSPSVCQQGPCATNWRAWACASPSECPTPGDVCCLTAGPVEADPKCAGYQKTKGFDNTACIPAAKCTGTVMIGKYTDNLTVVCAQQSDCKTGTCTAVKTTGTSIGLCL